MSRRPTRYTVLGTLVDRAICMPYAKPHVLRSGHRCRWDEDRREWVEQATIRADVDQAASLIVSSLESSTAQRDWSKADLALDPAGPWWSKVRDDFFDLDDDSREWVLDHLNATSDRAAERVQERAKQHNWEWLWSQPSFAVPGRDYPCITRPDLVAGLSSTRCVVLDLKTTSKYDLSAVAGTNQEQSFGDWTKYLKAMGFDPVGQWVLAVSTVEERAEWIEFSAGILQV
jgi:hypothetical protein